MIRAQYQSQSHKRPKVQVRALPRQVTNRNYWRVAQLAEAGRTISSSSGYRSRFTVAVCPVSRASERTDMYGSDSRRPLSSVSVQRGRSLTAERSGSESTVLLNGEYGQSAQEPARHTILTIVLGARGGYPSGPAFLFLFDQ